MESRRLFISYSDNCYHVRIQSPLFPIHIYMKAYYFILVLLISSIVSSCQHNNTRHAQMLANKELSPNKIDSLPSISEEFTDFEIIPLQTCPEGILSDVRKMIVTDSCMIFFDNSASPRVLSFNHDGTFRNQIGRLGHARDEYQQIQNIGADADGDTIIISNYSGIKYYTGDGQYLSTIEVESGNGPEDILLSDEGLYCGYFHRQGDCLMTLCNPSLKKIVDYIPTKCASFGTPLSVNNGNLIQKDNTLVYCLDVFSSSIYVTDVNTKVVNRYFIKYDGILTEESARDLYHASDHSQIVCFQAYKDMVRGMIDTNKGSYDFRFSLSDQTFDIMNHCDLNYSFDCRYKDCFYKILSPADLLNFLDEEKRYMRPIRKLLAEPLSSIKETLTEGDNLYVLKMRVVD